MRSPPAPAPHPPLPLMHRVCGFDGREDPVAVYERLGADARASIESLLGEDWSWTGKRVLDFGCGAGRTLRHFLGEAERSEFWGADIDEESIAWLADRLSPPLHPVASRPEPPLGLEYGSFDVIWALSVFTHLVDSSLPWLLELHRLLRPGGVLIATYMGRFNGEVFTHEPWDEDRIGMNVLRRHQRWDLGGPVVLMSDWWVQEHWGRAFELGGRLPNVQGQTWVLLRKREVALEVGDLRRPAADLREYEALRHNVRQVEREREAALLELRRGYERSGSWRVTAPLRAVARVVRAGRARRG
jgi:SAM-dependent methyltransferase